MGAAAPLTAELRQAAHHAAARGFWVFPLAPGTKVPAVPKQNWQDLATIDLATISRIWRRVPFNIGIACEPSGLHVVDLDVGKHQPPPSGYAGLSHGRDVLARLAADRGHPFPGPTYRVATPSGGEHLYFTAPPALRLRNTAGHLGWRIDTRGVGGYVVGAASRLPGGVYELLDSRSPVSLPDWLIRELTPAPRPPVTPVDLRSVRATAYVRAALQSQCDRITGAACGQRHETLVSAASSIGRLVGARLLARDEAHQVLRAAAATHVGVDGFTEDEVERTIRDGLDFGIARPREVRLH